MMRLMFLVIVCYISMQQLGALSIGIQLKRNNRWEDAEDVISGSTDSPTDAGSVTSVGDANILNWKFNLLMRPSPLKDAVTSVNSDSPLQTDGQMPANQRGSRGRRHAHTGTRGHHYHQPQLMRVGCVLGTCQVQNLSHRLYQLIGQSGRDDSSPINPSSPHSYG